jgi:hypothetical protein
MESIIELIKNAHIFITISLVVITLILFIVVLVLLKSISNLENKYRKFMRGVNNKNIEELVMSYLDQVDDVKKQSDFMKETYSNLDKRINECLQKVSIIRYRAFENVGSDLSYSIALLNHENDGVILTSIYGRNESTTYAKPINKGISRYDLSGEEEQVLKDATNKKLA